MVQNILDFFKNLPDKYCTECGEKIDEQSECYGNTCPNCLHVKSHA
ncbi:protein YhfH [Heyndrickxia faecalis]|uniref:Protein YhfH n=1 Tax=Heyndrickxia faecalis TaxID=2824910 RepID=A0AAU7WEM0_9BACI